jgi:hypothetical protein
MGMADYLGSISRDLGVAFFGSRNYLYVDCRLVPNFKTNSDDACDSAIVNKDCVWSLVSGAYFTATSFIGMIALAGYG